MSIFEKKEEKITKRFFPLGAIVSFFLSLASVLFVIAYANPNYYLSGTTPENDSLLRFWWVPVVFLFLCLAHFASGYGLSKNKRITGFIELGLSLLEAITSIIFFAFYIYFCSINQKNATLPVALIALLFAIVLICIGAYESFLVSFKDRLPFATLAKELLLVAAVAFIGVGLFLIITIGSYFDRDLRSFPLFYYVLISILVFLISGVSLLIFVFLDKLNEEKQIKALIISGLSLLLINAIGLFISLGIFDATRGNFRWFYYSCLYFTAGGVIGIGIISLWFVFYVYPYKFKKKSENDDLM